MSSKTELNKRISVTKELLEEYFRGLHSNTSTDDYEELQQQILSDYDKIDEYERVGIIKCPICGEIEVTPYGDDEHLPNLRCCNCNHIWLANGKLDDKDNLINEIKNYKEKLENIDRIVNTRGTYTNDNSWYQTLKKTLHSKGSGEEL